MRTGQMTAVDVEKNCSHFWVGGELTVHTLPNIQSVLLNQLDQHNEVEVDFSEVRVVDSAGVKALLAIRHEASRKNKVMHFVSRNEVFLKLLNLMYRPDFSADRAS